MAKTELIPVFIPSLVAILLNAEWNKGKPLTKQEVLEIRDKGECVMMTVEKAISLDESRGYNDIDPERVWVQWQEARVDLIKHKPNGPWVKKTSKSPSQKNTKPNATRANKLKTNKKGK